MKKLYAIIFVTFFLASAASAQDIPLFSQKLTNSFIYNPAVAGHNVGSLTYSYRNSYGGIANAPSNHFISVHTPVANHKIGIGLNFYMEDVNFIKTNYVSAAFAYHLRFTRYSSLSFGVSGEYRFMGLSGESNTDFKNDPVYLGLANGAMNNVDFSFGMLYANRYLKAGVSANRLATAWMKGAGIDSLYSPSGFYSAFLQGMIPMREGSDMLEPYVSFRKFSETNDAVDIGLYYTYNNKIMAGVLMRKGSVATVSAGFNLTPKLFLGYTREMYFSDIRAQVGASNEFTLRLNFKEYDYRKTFSDTYKSALAYRRKTMSTHSGTRGPGQLHRSQKKLASYSPNKRYQTTKKLSTKSSSQRYKPKRSKYKPSKKRRK